METNKIIIREPNASEEERKRICLEQLAQDRQQLLLRWPFIGGVIMRMELIPVRDDRLPTACTDGDNIFVDVNFYAKLKKEERLFVLAHEVWHSVLLHFARRQNRERERFNIATDLEIHFTLEGEKMKEPFVLPHDVSWRGLSAEEIYEKLSSGSQKGGGFMQIPGDNEPNTNFGKGSAGFDKHIYKDDQIPMPDSETADGDGGGDDKVKGDAQQSSSFVIDKDFNPCVKQDAVERSRSRTIASAQQVERTQGKLPANIQGLLDKLQKPSLPWQEMLKQFVTTCYGGKRRWLPPARRHVWQDLYLPSMREEALKAVVALDTSGSTQGDLSVFFGELVSLMNSFGKFDLDVIQCDAEIQNVEHFSDAKPPSSKQKWKVKGGGGTDFCPVFDYVRKNMHEQPDLLLFFTDGYGTAPQLRPAYPVMWVLTSDGNPPAKWGRVTHFKN